ncbi:hypothetical protein MTBPR1_30182 [Candidatus Terasakiella magnetica]|uniref:Uncharacterized protein n=1 Tax=Candidatus Terasakiella magnetica TaxID=1867952 RepID=A0A1C3RHY4_9PROT|nr:hypothetical protein [Candidatus Terasakiella magnetica]SCA56812.1 hypothetical protein MTBPR1_30182 [Candidatus Terasakiella magnetica]
MSIRVYIATTEGPVEVQRITREDPDVRSVVCENGTAKALPISRAYDSFVKEPTGVIQRSYDHPSYRMDLSAPITDGNSWQLGAFAAHALFAEDLLAKPEETVENAIWLTGELDRDLNVRPVNHIKEKLLASQEIFEKLRADNVRLFCFIPGGAGLVPDDEFLENLHVDGELLHLESLPNIQRIIQRFNLNDPLPDELEEEDEEESAEQEIDLYKPDPNAPPPIKDNRFAKIIALVVCLFALGIGLYLQFEDNIIALRAGSLKLGISELRANANQGCQAPDTIPLMRDGQSFPSSSLNGLCALEISVNNIGAPAYMWAFAQRLSDGHFLLADREGLMQAQMQKGLIGWRMILPKNIHNSIDYRVVALASSSPLSEAVNRMLRTSFGAKKPDWEKIKAQLVDEKITVISAHHSLLR